MEQMITMVAGIKTVARDGDNSADGGRIQQKKKMMPTVAREFPADVIITL